MGTIVEQTFTSWTEGLNNSAQPDDLAPNMVPGALNCQLKNISGGKAVYAWRPAVFGLFGAALTSNPKIISIYPYNIGGTQFLLLLGSDGKLYKYQLENTTTTTTYAAAITAVTVPQSWVTAKDVAFWVNGTDAKSYDGTTVGDFGITRPTVGSLAGAGGAAGSHNGTYELRVTYGISGIDAESSASNTAASSVTVTAANGTINWSDIPVSTDARVNRRYLYVRNTASMTNFYRAGTVSDNTSTTATTSIADTSLTIKAPSTTSNEPPPSGAKYLAWHKNRVFAATDTLVYWSNLGAPTAFNTLDSKVDPNPSDGQKITALTVFHDILIIFKERSMYAIVGDDPNSWIVKELYPAVGCRSVDSIVSVEDKLFWWSREGPMVWGGASQPINIGTPFINDTLYKINFQSYSTLHTVQVGLDVDGQRILWNLPITTDTSTVDTNYLRTYLLPFNYRLGRWESDGWTPTNVQSMATTKDNTYGTVKLYLGNDQGHLFRLSASALRDTFTSFSAGVPLDTSYATGTTTWSSSTQKTFTLTTATTASFFKGRTMMMWTSDGLYKGDRRILSNTTTTVTVDGAFDPADMTYPHTGTYYIAGHGIVLDLPWWDFGAPFKKKRLEYIYLLSDGMTVDYPVTIQVFVDGEETAVAQSIAANLYNATLMNPEKLRAEITGRTFKIRILDHRANADRFLVMQVTLRGEILSDNLN